MNETSFPGGAHPSDSSRSDCESLLEYFELIAQEAATAGTGPEREAKTERAAAIVEQLREIGLAGRSVGRLVARLAELGWVSGAAQAEGGTEAASAADPEPDDALAVLFAAHRREPEVAGSSRAVGTPGVTLAEVHGLSVSNAPPVAATDPEVKSTTGVLVSVEALARVQYAMHANDVPVLREIRIENETDEVLRDLRIVIRADPAFAHSGEIKLDEVRPGQLRRLDDPRLALDHGLLDRMTERTVGSLTVELWSHETLLASTRHGVTVFARNEWPGDGVYPELLAAFVQPNEPALARLLSRAGEVLSRWSGDPSIDGYQRQDPEAVLRQVAAIYEAVRGEQIQYVSPPASFESGGQRVRLPGLILEHRQATCLDLALLVAAAVEQAGMHPIVALVEGHAFCGVWLDEQSLPDASTDDPARIRNHLENGDLVVFDPTTATAGSDHDFASSQQIGRRHLIDDAKFRVVIDVHRARRGQVRPLPTIGAVQSGLRVASGDVTTPREGAAPSTADIAAARGRRARAVSEADRGPKRIETWKRKLLDLTLRNRLLNIPERGKFVDLFVPDVAKLEDGLADGARFKVRHRPDELGQESVHEGGVRRRLTVDDLRPHLVEEQEGGLLYADMEREPLEKRLTSLLRDAKTAEEEGGSSNLYLSVGVLRYFETEKSEKARLAPVVLVPVSLKRNTVSEGIVLEGRAEDARINVTLLRYLEEMHGVRVENVDPPPEDGSGLDIRYIFQRFREEILPKRGWEIVEDARIGMFSFSKMLIWRDLDEYASHLLESAVMRHLVETPNEPYSDGVDFKRVDELDAKASSVDTFVPLDADSSQLAAILAAAEGKSFVLIGPPGTGKSQTITNLITHCLAMGRSVLFVSEKMAALEVVHRRLSRVGLADHCLELHSNKAKKKQVLEQLAASLHAENDAATVDRDGIARGVDELRQRLNGYVGALHRVRPSGETVYQVLSRLIGLSDVPRIEIDWSDIGQTPAPKLQAAREALKDAQVAAEAAAVGAGHSLAGIGQTSYTPLWEREARKAIDLAVESLEALERTISVIREPVLGDMTWPVWSEREDLLRALSLLARPVAVSSSALNGSDWDAAESQISAALEAIEVLRSESEYFDQHYARERGAIDEVALLADLQEVDASWFVARFFGRRRWKRALAAAAGPDAAVEIAQAVDDLQRLGRLKKREASFGALSVAAERVFGGLWEGLDSDLPALREALDWVRGVRDAARELAGRDPSVASGLLGRWVAFLPGGTAGSDTVLGAFAELEQRWEGAAKAASLVVQQLRVQVPEPWLRPEPSPCLEQADQWLAGWGGIKAWCRWRTERERAVAADVGVLVGCLEAGALAADQLCDAFERGYGEEWYVHTISSDEHLADFESEDHERAIARFRQLDEELMAATRASVRGRVDSQRRSKSSLRSGVQGGFLRREIQKQKRHKPIRTVFKEAGDLVREIRPCLLMSPLSVAQYLDPSLPRFDVVVFDEASQMPVWDAIGAVARGNQLIVVGDPKQLPPTNFFGKSDSETDEDEETEDLESVLDECIASNIDQHTLTWHYRSRHESLIAFSNRNYYDGRLITFPSAVDHGLGVSWRPVPEGVYDYGKSRTNRGEAEAVVAEIVRRLKDPILQRHTIGVVALSQAQQTLVLDLLDEARRAHPEIERFFDESAEERVFVKNLENVQGDERDVILFTICYGPDMNGRVRMSFGPLNKEGGWRRLNVAITRARREVLVFSTLTHDQIDLNRSKSAGVRDLRRFLQFAELGEEAFRRELAVDPDGEFDSPFEAEVAAALEERGHTVRRQVGCSGYRIDLAIVDPQRPGRFLLGVECDGASYHSAPSARDRDKLRQELLEGLGWRIHRIWSTDWWQDRDREIGDLFDAIDQAERRSEHVASRDVEPDRHRSPSAGDSPDAVELASASPSNYAANSAPAVVRVASLPFEGTGAPTGNEPFVPSTPTERVNQVLKEMRECPDGHRFLDDLAPYRATSGVTRGAQETFYTEQDTTRIVRALRDVVRSEAPILESVAVRRVGELWGFKRMKSKAAARVAECVALARLHVTIDGEDRVLWSEASDAIAYHGARLPVTDDDERCQRTVAEVPLVELAELLRFWIDEAGPMAERELLEHANRSLGFMSLGSKIRGRLEMALATAIETGVLERRGELIRRGGR